MKFSIPPAVERPEKSVLEGVELKKPPAKSMTTWVRWTAGPCAAAGMVVVVAAVILIALGASQFVGYDSFWHVFIAKQDNWAGFWTEVIDNAHPPLYYFLLGVDIRLLGESLLAYRAISIVATLLSTVLIVRTVGALTGNTWLAILAGASHGLSANAVEVGLEVRAYALCVTLLLIAFSAYVDWLGTHPARLRPYKRALFAGAMTTAVLTNYSACFFLAAAMAAPIMLFFLHRRWRLRLKAEIKHHSLAMVLMFAIPLLMSAAVYLLHVRRWANRLNHVPNFMYDPSSESIFAYVARTSHKLFLLGFPEIPTGPVITITVALVLLATWGWLVSRRRVRGRLGIIPLMIFPAMVFLNLLAGLAGRYPYGGTLRHEIFLFPFAIAAFFVLLDSVRRQVPLPWSSNRMWLSAITLGIAISCAAWMTNYRFVTKALMQDQMERFRAVFKTPSTVLVDQFNFIIFFSHHHDWEWHLVWQNPNRRGLWQIWEVSKPGQRFRVCRSKKWHFDFSQTAAFADIRECLSHTDQVAVFRPQQRHFPPAWEVAATPQLAHALGREIGLFPETVLVEGNDVYMLFRSSEGEGSEQRITVREATYGQNCGASAGNSTALLKEACDGRQACTFQVDSGVIGDPVPGCAKNFIVSWNCGDNSGHHQIAIDSEAGFGSVAFLTCSP